MTDGMAAARQSEKHICQQLIHQGWLVLARNHRKRGVEIDVIAQKGGTVIALEVKARHFCREGQLLFKPRQVARIKAELVPFLAARHLPYQTLRVDGALVLFRRPWRVVAVRYFVGISEENALRHT